MKVLWVCNVPNADACKHLGITGVNIGGWLTGLSNSLKKSDIDLVYCYPKLEKPNQDIFEVDHIKYYSFYAKSKWGINANCDTLETREQIAKILSDENPDVIHIFGTEYVHSYIFYQLAADKEIICCSIQGLTSIIAKHYLSLIPFEQIRRLNLSCIVKGTLKRQQKRCRLSAN